MNIGTNIESSVKDNILTLKIDLSQTFGRSKSGKSETVASTGGNKTIEGTDIKLGLNCYK